MLLVHGWIGAWLFSLAHANPLCVAHRGYHADRMENSLGAFQAALEIRVPAIELDVRHTRDGEPILLHDPDLARVAKRRPGRECKLHEPVARLSLSEIARGCELEDGQPIATLPDALDLLATSDALVFIELKDDPDPRTLGLIRDRLDPARARIISFDSERLRPLGSSLPGFSRMHLSRRAGSVDLGFEGVDVEHADARDISGWKERGKEVSVWTKDWRWTIRRAIRNGAELVTTNQPARCMKEAGRADALELWDWGPL